MDNLEIPEIQRLKFQQELILKKRKKKQVPVRKAKHKICLKVMTF